MRAYQFATIAALALSPCAANAAKQTLTVTGRVNDVRALQDGTPADAPVGKISVGDAFVLTASFDFSMAQLTSLYDADPAINIYNLPGTAVAATIGSYTTTFFLSDSNSSIQLWNDYVVVDPVDSQSFYFFNYNLKPKNGFAFPVGKGSTSESFTFNLFDSSATARSSDLISEIAPLSSFGSKMLSYGLLNADTKYFAYVQADVLSASLSSVPEPATWGLMIFGFGAIGGMMRRYKIHFDTAAPA